MRKKVFLTLLCSVILVLATGVTATADTGPKPSVVVTFKGLQQKSCYVTLLSKTPSTGPYTAYNYQPYYARYKQGDGDYEIWQKFASYQDRDGYYFLQYFTKLSDSAVYTWGYYPPKDFKILMYFPGEDSFVISSEAYTQYAFHSYYTVDASALGAHPAQNGTIKAVKSYDSSGEVVSLLARIAVTIAVEVAVALPFGFRHKKQLLVILVTNVITQVILNLLLNLINYNLGPAAFVLNYIWMEILVFALEAWIYREALPQYGVKAPMQKPHPIVYALTANAASFVAGLWLVHLIPGIF